MICRLPTPERKKRMEKSNEARLAEAAMIAAKAFEKLVGVIVELYVLVAPKIKKELEEDKGDRR